MNQSTKTALTLAASMAALVAMMFFRDQGTYLPTASHHSQGRHLQDL